MLQAVVCMGLNIAEMKDHEKIIKKMLGRCNAGRNRAVWPVWRQQFAARKRENETAGNWICELRDLARNCEFAADCWTNCDPTRILAQIVFGVYDDHIHRKLLKKGATLTVDQAISIQRTAEAVPQQAPNLKSGKATSIQAVSKSTYKKNVPQRRPEKQTKETNQAEGC